MGERTHTPGPWKVEVHEKSGRVCVLGARGDGNVRALDGLGHLFSVDCAVPEDADMIMFPQMQEEMIAVAHLAAASPDMLEALRLVKQLYAYTGPDADGFAATVERQIDLAIAKASPHV